MTTSGQVCVDAADEARAAAVSEGFATVAEAAEFLRLSRAKVYQLMESGDLLFGKFGKARRVPWAALRAFAVKCLAAS